MFVQSLWVCMFIVCMCMCVYICVCVLVWVWSVFDVLSFVYACMSACESVYSFLAHVWMYFCLGCACVFTACVVLCVRVGQGAPRHHYIPLFRYSVLRQRWSLQGGPGGEGTPSLTHSTFRSIRTWGRQGGTIWICTYYKILIIIPSPSLSLSAFLLLSNACLSPSPSLSPSLLPLSRLLHRSQSEININKLLKRKKKQAAKQKRLQAKEEKAAKKERKREVSGSTELNINILTGTRTALGEGLLHTQHLWKHTTPLHATIC